MFDFFNLLLEFLRTYASLLPEAAAKAVIVLISVFVLRALTIIPSSNWARAANVLFSVLLSGALTGATESEVAVLSMTAAFAASLWEACVWAWTTLLKRQKPFTK